MPADPTEPPADEPAAPPADKKGGDDVMDAEYEVKG